MDFIPDLKPVFSGDAHRALRDESFDAINSRTLANVEIANQNGELGSPASI